MRSIVAVVSDFQSGSSLGLVDPTTLLDRDDEDGHIVQIGLTLTPPQKYLFPIYEEGIAKTFALAGTDPIHLIVNGDMTQGDRFNEDLSQSLHDDQVKIAVTLIERWLKTDQVKSIRLTKSTRVHAYKEGSADKAIARDLRKAYPKKNIRLVSHGLATIDGALIDYAHHGPPGGARSWLKSNLMFYYVKSIIDTCIKDGRPLPSAVLRAHKHERVEAWVVDWMMDKRIKAVGITTPSFQMLTAHAQKVTSSEPKVTNGMVALEIVDGAIKDVHWFAKTRYLPATETLK